jgi:integrase
MRLRPQGLFQGGFAKGNGSESSSRRASPRTVHHYYSVLRAFFNWAVKEGLLIESPVIKVRLPKPQQKVIRPYTVEQIKAMLQVCDHDYQHNAKFLGSRNKAIILILLDSGLRVSELANIKLPDIDVERGWIKVVGKGTKERVVHIGKVAAEGKRLLQALRACGGIVELKLVNATSPMLFTVDSHKCLVMPMMMPEAKAEAEAESEAKPKGKAKRKAKAKPIEATEVVTEQAEVAKEPIAEEIEETAETLEEPIEEPEAVAV